MRVLLVKTSSLGDVIHTLPAITDAARARPGLRFDWVVEEAFAEIPAWHPAVDRILPVAMRRWRWRPFSAATRAEWRIFLGQLNTFPYDFVIDAQGLVKSAWLARKTHSPVHGLDRHSAREPLASLAYNVRHGVPRDRHAVRRVRELFASTFGYTLPANALGEGDGASSADAAAYGLDRTRVLAGSEDTADSTPRLLFLHGTTWPTKHWPEHHWRELARIATAAGWQVRLPWGNEAEHDRARRIAQGFDNAQVLPRLPLKALATELAGAAACVAVDTGLGHLAAALDVPAVSLFGPTNPGFTGAWGQRQVRVASDLPCAPCLRKKCMLHTSSSTGSGIIPPCFARLPPERVWATLTAMLERSGTPAPLTASSGQDRQVAPARKMTE